MTRAVGNGLIKTLADTIGTGAVGRLAKQVAGLSTDVANIKTPDIGSGLMFNPDTGKLYIPCGNGVTVNKNTGMLEVPIGEHLRYTGSGLDVPDADETTAGVVKLTHEVSNRDDGEWAITADGVYAYAPGYNTPPSDVSASVLLSNGKIDSAYVSGGYFFCNISNVTHWEKNTIAIRLQNYHVPKSFVYHGAVTSIGQIPIYCRSDAGDVVLSPQKNLIVSEPATVFVIVPVYKL